MFSNRGSSFTRTYDRLIGIFVTIGAVLTLGAASNFMQRLYTAHKKREEEEERRRRGLGAKGDDLHQSRWKNAQGPQAVHSGACHCNRIRFRVRAATTVYAVDVPSKVRFPRLSIPVENFEPLTDESIMSMYAVKTAAQGMGIHTFCSYCGTMHDLVDVTAVELHKPVGWCQIRLHAPGAGSGDGDADGAELPLRTHLLQVRVLSMHQGGKDTHVRQLCVFGPRPPPPTVFKTVDMLQHVGHLASGALRSNLHLLGSS